MNDQKGENTNRTIASEKTNSSSVNDDFDIDPNNLPRNNRNTISVNFHSLNSISHQASFQSKLMFFNSKAVAQEPNKNKNKNFTKEVKKIKKEEKYGDLDDNGNLNINEIIGSKNNNSDLNNVNDKTNDKEIKKFKSVYYKKYTANLQYHSPIEEKTSDSKEKKTEKIIEKTEKKQIDDRTKKIEEPPLILKSLDEQWYYQKILLDYNILDFTSKYNFYKSLLIKYSDL